MRTLGLLTSGEGVALVGSREADAFKIAELAVQLFEFALRRQLELQYLTVFKLAELLGLLVAGNDFVNGSRRKAYLFEQGRKRIAFETTTSLWLGLLAAAAAATSGVAGLVPGWVAAVSSGSSAALSI